MEIHFNIFELFISHKLFRWLLQLGNIVAASEHEKLGQQQSFKMPFSAFRFAGKDEIVSPVTEERDHTFVKQNIVKLVWEGLTKWVYFVWLIRKARRLYNDERTCLCADRGKGGPWWQVKTRTGCIGEGIVGFQISVQNSWISWWYRKRSITRAWLDAR